MLNNEINKLVESYKKEYIVAVHSETKRYVIMGGNMTVNKRGNKMELFSTVQPTVFDSKTCDVYIKKHSNFLIQYHKVSYEKWLQKRIEFLGKFGG
jgi:hypothetical protein